MIRQFEAKITDFTQADYTKQYSLLECAIREKIDAKRSLNARMQSLAGYILLYRALGEMYPKMPIKITFNQYGKPMCDLCFFSISHSEDRVVCVISDKPVGVDIQKIKAITKRKKYKFFNSKECYYVNQNDALVGEHYIEIFAKKEAAVKMLGTSLIYAYNIDTFSNQLYFEVSKKEDFLLCICSQNFEIM